MSTLLVDLKNTVVGDFSVRPQAALTADTNGGAIDLLLAEGPVHACVGAGVTDFASTDEVYLIKLQESDTSGGTYTDIDGATTTVTAQNTTKWISTGKRTKRYVRAVLDVSGTTPSILLSVCVFARAKVTGAGAGTSTT